MKVFWAALSLFLVVFGTLLWASDQVTLQGERTIYTVECQGGHWEGLRCTGRLVPGNRHRFRSSRSRHEVLYWIAGSKSPSGKLSDCQVKDRDNWSCNAEIGQPPTIAHELTQGRPTSHLAGLAVPFHAVAKMKWLALEAGFDGFHEADFSNDLSAFPPRY